MDSSTSPPSAATGSASALFGPVTPLVSARPDAAEARRRTADAITRVIAERAEHHRQMQALRRDSKTRLAHPGETAEASRLRVAESRPVRGHEPADDDLFAQLVGPLRSGLTVLVNAAALLERERAAMSEGGQEALDLLQTELRWHRSLSMQLLELARLLASDLRAAPDSETAAPDSETA